MTRTSVFACIVAGVDGTAESLEAVRQAARLLVPGGTLHLVCAVNLARAATAGWSAPRLAEELEREGGDALQQAQEIAPQATRSLLDRRPVGCLLDEVERMDATLLAVGTHGRSRPEGILLGGVATTMLHEAPCPVLVAHPPRDRGGFPGIVAVGVDGSPHSLAAAAVAAELAARFGAALRPVVALRGKDVDVETALAQLPGVRVDESADPVSALVEVSREADLLVVGNRGLHGLQALGSVSERVAHRAQCSVLVVRGRS
jgi:nucleotide-binding universal stress UspA family protein